MSFEKNCNEIEEWTQYQGQTVKHSSDFDQYPMLENASQKADCA